MIKISSYHINIMKKFVIVILVCICLSSPFWFGYIKESFSNQKQAPQQSEESKVATWKDANFEKLIRIYLGKSDEDILLKELEDITELRIVSKISIETNLKKHEIENSDSEHLGLITSMADVDNFINLKKLEISSNFIEAIENVKISSNITELDLALNNLSDSSISELKNYTALESLNLCYNPLDDINVLKELKSLRILDLSYTGERADNVFGCEKGKVNFSVIKELPLLEELYVPFTTIENLDQLNSLANLKKLSLSQCTFLEDELMKIKELQGLEELWLCDVSMGGEFRIPIDLSLLSSMKNLRKLTVNDNIYNIDAISEDVELKIIPFPQ